MKRDVVALRGQGISQEKVGRVLGISQQAVAKIEKAPDVREAIARGRLIWRSIAAEEAENLARPIWGMAKECIEKGDSKGLDNTTRAIAAVNKVTSDVAGETQKVELSGGVTTGSENPMRELLQLVRVFAGEDPGALVEILDRQLQRESA
jgi:hypothetical protein